MDSPVDTESSTLPPERDAFAHAMAEALGEWSALPLGLRHAVAKICPGMARALWRAEVTMDAITGEDEDHPDPLTTEG